MNKFFKYLPSIFILNSASDLLEKLSFLKKRNQIAFNIKLGLQKNVGVWNSIINEGQFESPREDRRFLKCGAIEECKLNGLTKIRKKKIILQSEKHKLHPGNINMVEDKKDNNYHV